MQVVPAVRWLALIPFLRCLHSFMADALSGAGRAAHAHWRSTYWSALINVALNLLILPRLFLARSRMDEPRL
jgi:O-antigen/teichoic acid export membrane protein